MRFFGDWLEIAKRNVRNQLNSKVSAKNTKRRRREKFGLELLEERRLLTSTLYVDFGDRFLGDNLTAAQNDWIYAKSGSNPEVDAPAIGSGPASMIRIDSFNPIASRAGVNSRTYRDEIMKHVKDFYSPFDIQVVELTANPILVDGASVRAAQNLLDISRTFGANNGSIKHVDSYIFVGEMFVDGMPQNDLNGVATGVDATASHGNLHEGTAFVNAFVRGRFRTSVEIASTIAHEAGHLFGLRHSYRTDDTSKAGVLGPNYDRLHSSDTMSYLRDRELNVFSRYPMLRGDENSAIGSLSDLHAKLSTRTSYDQFIKDPQIGKGAFEYVTGTGLNDKITIIRTSPGTARVTIQAFLKADYTSPLNVPGSSPATSIYSYDISLSQPIVIDGAAGDDWFIIDGALGTQITVRGNKGESPSNSDTDKLEILGSSLLNAVYTPGTTTTSSFLGQVGFGYSRYSDLRGTITVGATRIKFQEFDPSSAVMISDVRTVTIQSAAGTDDWALANLSGARSRLSGTMKNRGVNIVPLFFSRVENLIVDVGTGDSSFDGDTVTIGSALTAAGLRNLTVRTGSGDDRLVFKTTDLRLPVSPGTFFYDAGAGIADTVETNGNADLVLSNLSLVSSVGGQVVLSSVENANLYGGSNSNSYDLSGWTGTGWVFGNGGIDQLVVSKNTDIQLTDFFISSSDGLGVSLSNILVAHLTGGVGNNLFNVSGWTGTGTVAGGQGVDRLFAEKDVDFNASDSAILTTDGMSMTLAGIETEELIGGSSPSQFNLIPSRVTRFEIDGRLPTFAGPGVDFLNVDFTTLDSLGQKPLGKKLTYTDKLAGNGQWTFSNRLPIRFINVEKNKFFPIIAIGSDVGKNGLPVVEVYDADTGEKVNSNTIMAYEPTYRLGVRVATGDLDGDGIPEIVTIPGKLHAPEVKVFSLVDQSNVVKVMSFLDTAFGSRQDGFYLAVGDVSGDRKSDIVVSAGFGQVDIHTWRGTTTQIGTPGYTGTITPPVFDATRRITSATPGTFGANFIGGSTVAVADFNFDGWSDIVVGSGVGVRATIAMYSGKTMGVLRRYQPLEASFTGGLFVAAGNVVGSKTPDIIAGTGQGGRGRFVVVDVATGATTAYQAFNDSGDNSAVRVAVSDIRNDGKFEVFAGQSQDGRTRRVKRWTFTPSPTAVDDVFSSIDSAFGGFMLG